MRFEAVLPLLIFMAVADEYGRFPRDISQVFAPSKGASNHIYLCHIIANRRVLSRESTAADYVIQGVIRDAQSTGGARFFYHRFVEKNGGA